MLVEHLVDIGRVVLAGDSEQHAALVEGAERLLECLVGIAGINRVQSDAVDSVLADDPTPERIIEIEYDALFRTPLQDVDNLGVLAGERQKHPLVDRHLGEVAHPLIVPREKAVTCDKRFVIDNIYAGLFP